MSRVDRHSKFNKKGQIAVISALVVLLLALAGYSYRSTYYANRFLPQTFVEGMNVSDLTLAEANKKLHNRYASQEFTLTENSQEWKKINKADFGLQTDFADELQGIQKKQNQWTWGAAFLTGKHDHSLGNTAFDEEKLAQASENLKKEIDELNKERTQTKDAEIKSDETGFSIVPEVRGDSLNSKELIEDLKSGLTSDSESLEIETYKAEPKITADNQDLQREVESLNAFAHLDAKYTINGETFQIPTESIVDWLVYKDDHAEFDRDKVYKYVSGLSKKYNTSSNPTKFKSTKRGEVSVPAGSLSWTIAMDSETDALIADLMSGNDFTRSPISQGSKESGSALVGNTYVEVDLENQYMWYYKDGEVVLETAIVSGKPKTPTPPGVFYIWNKERNSTLRGTNDDGSKYATPVSYWMPIDWTGVGIHDASWQPTFGGSRWLTGGSHGCINTPPGVMQQLYDQVDMDTPVLVF